VELRHLRYFIAAAEESTIVAAAKRLRLAQPALTRQIHDLEREIGVEVFERGARGVQLTPAGDVVLVSARHILRQLDVGMEYARGASQGTVGRCVICVGARGLSSGLIARIAAVLHAEYPAIDVAVIEATATRQWKALQTLEADIGLGLPAPAEYSDLVSETFGHDVFDSILVTSTHPLASRESVSLADLAPHPMVTWSARVAPEFNRQMRTEFKRIGVKLPPRREFEQISAVIAMVNAGQGWTFFPSKFPQLATSGTVVIPLTDFKIPLPHAVLSRKTDIRPVTRTVLNVIRRIASEERRTGGAAPVRVVARVSGAHRVAADGTDESRSAAIELRHLRYYCAVVDARSFGRAAERLELTQPALSRQIRDLERAVGIELLERAARGATTTPGGESFYKSAKRILDEAAAIPAEAHRAERGVVARCVIATVPTQQARTLVSELLRICASEMPNVEILVEDFATPKQPGELRAARIDIGLCHASPLSPVEQRGLRRERLFSDTVNCALVATDSPLATREEIELRELAEIPFLFVGRSFQPGLHDMIHSAFEGHAFTPRVDNSYDGLQTLWAMVAQGIGWAIGFASQCADPPPGTVAVPVKNLAIPWGLDVLCRKDEARTLVLLVIDMLHDIARAQELESASA
jgi:DNA-binding transcriptional LysR family regulator